MSAFVPLVLFATFVTFSLYMWVRILRNKCKNDCIYFDLLFSTVFLCVFPMYMKNRIHAIRIFTFHFHWRLHIYDIFPFPHSVSACWLECLVKDMITGYIFTENMEVMRISERVNDDGGKDTTLNTKITNMLWNRDKWKIVCIRWIPPQGSHMSPICHKLCPSRLSIHTLLHT